MSEERPPENTKSARLLSPLRRRTVDAAGIATVTTFAVDAVFVPLNCEIEAFGDRLVDVDVPPEPPPDPPLEDAPHAASSSRRR